MAATPSTMLLLLRAADVLLGLGVEKQHSIYAARMHLESTLSGVGLSICGFVLTHVYIIFDKHGLRRTRSTDSRRRSTTPAMSFTVICQVG